MMSWHPQNIVLKPFLADFNPKMLVKVYKLVNKFILN